MLFSISIIYLILTLEGDLNRLKENAMERNAWYVAKDVMEQIQGEPGPAGDFMQFFVTPQKEDQLFSILNSSNSLYQQQNLKKHDEPGYAYFTKLNAFIEQHVHVGELYLKYIKGDCQQNSGVLCEFCTKVPPSRDSLHRVPRPRADEMALPDLKY